MGCIAATVLGVVIGIARLSKNWIVSRLMAVYVESFRNVPVLLWIIFAMAIIIETLPQPKEFRGGEDATASMILNDSVAITGRGGFYVPEPLFSNSLGNVHLFGGASSLRFDVSLDLVALLVVFIGSLLISHMIGKRANATQEKTGGDRPTVWHIRLGVVVLPTLAVLFALGFHLGYPELKGFNFRGGIHMRSSLIALWGGPCRFIPPPSLRKSCGPVFWLCRKARPRPPRPWVCIRAAPCRW